MNIDPNSILGRTLLALRAGEMTTAEIYERWPSSAASAIQQTVRQGYAEKIDEAYRLTPAGRAACPLRNPLSASGGPIKPAKEPSMTTVQQPAATTPAEKKRRAEPQLETLNFLKKGGVPSTVRDIAQANDLKEKQVMNACFWLLKKGMVDYFVLGGKRYYSALGEVNESTGNAAEIPAPAPAEKAQKTGIPVQKSESKAAMPEPAPLPAVPAQIKIDLGEADDIEIGIWSDGCLDIIGADVQVSLSKPVTAKLRTFLGLVQE